MITSKLPYFFTFSVPFTAIANPNDTICKKKINNKKVYEKNFMLFLLRWFPMMLVKIPFMAIFAIRRSLVKIFHRIKLAVARIAHKQPIAYGMLGQANDLARKLLAIERAPRVVFFGHCKVIFRFWPTLLNFVKDGHG